MEWLLTLQTIAIVYLLWAQKCTNSSLLHLLDAIGTHTQEILQRRNEIEALQRKAKRLETIIAAAVRPKESTR